MTIVDALTILGIGSGEIRRSSWDSGQWLEFEDSKMVNPEILTTDDLTAEDWCWNDQ